MSIKISLILATYNRGHRLVSLFKNLEIQTIDKNAWEIIVCVDGSTDNTEEVIKTWQAKNSLPLNYFIQKNTGQAGARHSGISKAKGEYIIIIDDDMQLAPDFLQAHLDLNTRYNGDAVVIGKVIPLQDFVKRPLYEAVREDFMYRLHKNLEQNSAPPPSAIALVTQNVSFSKELYTTVGGFDPFLRLGEDTELGIKFERAKAKFVFGSKAWAIHNSDVGSYQKWAQRQYEYGKYFVYIWKKYDCDPPLHPLRNHVAGSKLNKLMTNVIRDSKFLAYLATGKLRILGYLLQKLACYQLAIATHKAIQAIITHQGTIEALGGLQEFYKAKTDLLADINCPKSPNFPNNK